MKKSFRILLTLVLVLVTLLSLTACISDCDAGMHAFVEIPAKEATCTEAGNVAYKRCRVCELCLDENGKQISQANTIIPAKGHDLDEHPASAPTCTADGTVQYWDCKTCGAKFSDKDATAEITVIVDGATGHVNTTHKDEIPATCTKTGTRAHDVCDCGALLVDGKVVEAKDLVIEIDVNAHKFGTWINEVPATCVKEGTLAHKDCEYCNKHFDNNGKVLDSIEIETDTNAHKPASEWSHDESGHYHACENGCGARLDETAHTPETITGKPATCTENGLTDGSKCKDCGHIITEQQTINAQHSWQSTYTVDTPATCTDPGSKSIHCSKCDATKDATEISALGHDYGTLVKKQPATCSATGREAYYYCESCKTYFTESKVATNWADLEIAKDSTNHTALTTGGQDETYHYGAHCTDCGYTQAKEEHKGQGWIHSTDDAGKHYHYQKCTCGYILGTADCTSGAPKDEDVNDSTCLATGTKDVVTYCTVCEKEISRQTGVEIEKKPHTYGDWIAETPATCINEGTLGHYHCSACEHNFDSSKNELSSLTIAIDTTNGHSWTNVPQKPATCTEDGYTAHQECTLCHTTTGKTVLPKGHDVQYHDAKTPTCTEIGWDAYETCSRCDYTTKVEILATGHVNTTHKDEIPATCVKEGTKAHDVCGDCGALLIDGKVVEAKDLVIEIDESAHKPASDWFHDEGGHYHKCQNEGCEEKLDLASHNVEGASWKSDNTKHWKECVDCGAKVGETDHVAQGDWQSNDTNHWQLCECGAKVGETAHTPVTDKAVEPDCTNVGKTEGSHCEICSRVIVEQTEVPATGHDYGDLVAKVPETCTTNGVEEHYRCTVCDGYFKNDEAKTPTTLEDLEISASHIYVYADTSSTHHTKTCKNCDMEAVTEAHSYTDGVCVCGKTAPSWSLVTDVSELKVGDQIIFVYRDGEKAVAAAGEYDSSKNILKSVALTQGVTSLPNDVVVFTLGSNCDAWSFIDKRTDKVLAYKGSGNKIYSVDADTLSVAGQWAWTITNNDGKIEIVNTALTSRKIQYNATNNQLRFACYESKMKDVSIYKLILCDHSGKETAKTVIPATCTEPENIIIKCSYCGDVVSETTNGSALGHNLTYTTTDTHHSATCSRCDYVVESTLHSYGDSHTCVCGKTEPSYVVTVINNGIGDNKATVTLSGTNVAGKENEFYQNTTVTITVTAPTDYIAKAKIGDDEIALIKGAGSFDITDTDVTVTITLESQSSHEHTWGNATQIEGNADEHKLTCGCGEITLEAHTPEDIPNVAPTCTDSGTTGGKRCSECGYIIEESTVVTATGHTYVYSNSSNSQHTATCSKCGHSELQDHSYGEDNKCTCGAENEIWTLVTDVSTLSAGDQIVIVAKDSNYALSTTQNTNNRGQATVTKNNENSTVTFVNGVQTITLEVGKTDKTWAFNTGSGYLYAASSSKNYLKTETTLSDNSSWSIDIAEDGTATIKAQGSYTRNQLQYNKSSSIFSCYSSSQQDVVIYKLG